MTIPSTHLFIQTLILGVLVGGVYALMASGLTLIFGVMRVINVAHGAFLILGAYFTYWLFTLTGLDPLLSLVITVPLLFAIGWVVQRYLLTRIQNPEQASVLVTFAMAITMEGLMGTVWKTTVRTVRPEYASSVIELANYRLPVTRLAGFAAALVVLILLYIMLQRTNLGRAIRATIQDRNAARLVGVNVEMVAAHTFGIGIATAAAGGSLLSMIYSFNASSQTDWISRILSIIVLGGMGSLPGALLAALVLGVMEQLTAIVITLYWSPIVFYIFLFLTLIIRPQGLMGEVVREKA
ncbi:MAG TPA: branched-chain amino acid ABC transporter permease [Anaerolineales bacterium]|nr:branched-chain amino acid ABC transporter permease [Anaerolineales bacterium]